MSTTDTNTPTATRYATDQQTLHVWTSTVESEPEAGGLVEVKVSDTLDTMDAADLLMRVVDRMRSRTVHVTPELIDTRADVNHRCPVCATQIAPNAEDKYGEGRALVGIYRHATSLEWMRQPTRIVCEPCIRKGFDHIRTELVSRYGQRRSHAAARLAGDPLVDADDTLDLATTVLDAGLHLIDVECDWRLVNQSGDKVTPDEFFDTSTHVDVPF